MHSSQSRPPNYPYRERDDLARDLDAGRISSNQRVGADPEEPEYYAESPSVAPPNYVRASGFERRRLANAKRSIARRVFGAVARFFFAVLLGVGATLAWQSCGDQAESRRRAWAPSLGWLLPVSTAAAPMAAATVPDLVEQLKPISLDLVIVRRSLEQIATNQDQLAAKQEQVAQNLATLQEVEQEIRQAVRIPPRKPSAAAGQSLH